MNERKYYLDNIRWITVLLVIIYHIIYIFNCSGVITNMPIQGIPILDTVCIFVYPWFMCLLFVFAYGWICGVVTSKFTDIFMGNGDKVPGLMKYLIYCLMGTGPLWYAHVLFVVSILIVLLLGYSVVTYMKLPFILNYIIILIGTIVILPIVTEIIKRIPIINKLLLGINKRSS